MEGKPDNEWCTAIDAQMKRLGRTMSKDGKPVTDEQEKRALQQKVVDDVKNIKLPFLRRMGAI